MSDNNSTVGYLSVIRRSFPNIARWATEKIKRKENAEEKTRGRRSRRSLVVGKIEKMWSAINLAAVVRLAHNVLCPVASLLHTEPY